MATNVPNGLTPSPPAKPAGDAANRGACGSAGLVGASARIVTGLVLALCAMVPSGVAGTLRVTTWNLQTPAVARTNGAAAKTNAFRIQAAAAELKKLDPDVILLQQVRDLLGPAMIRPEKSRVQEEYLLGVVHAFDRTLTAAALQESADLVPKSWELCRRSPDGQTKVLAGGVLAYDVSEKGGVVFTNGNAIFQLDAEGRKQQLVSESMIEQVFFVPEADAADN